MPLGFDSLIDVDWKAPGSDLLVLFRHYYPDISVFSGDVFETLYDELHNEMPEVCLQALVPLLAQLGYDLWNLDSGGDDYRPVIVATKQRQAFVRYWQSSQAPLEVVPTLIEPLEPALPAAKETGAAVTPKTRKLKWLQETHDYPGPTYVYDYAYSHGWAAITEHDEDQCLCFLIDYNQWPPAEHDMLDGRNDGADGADLRLLDASAQRSLWARCIRSGDRFQDDRFVYELREGNDIQRFGPADLQWPAFEEPQCVVDSQVFARQCLYEPEHLTRIWRITAETSEVIFEYTDTLTLLPFGPGRLLFMQHNGPLCWIWHQDAPLQTIAGQPLPADAYHLRATTAYLGGDEILLFSEEGRPNPEHPGYQETVLLAWRFNVVTGATRKARLDGFGSELRQETRMLVTQPKHTITLRTFHGQISVAEGHEGWWVWNYQTQTFGSYTLAWLWNQHSDQVIKLSSRDIPRIKPQIRYLPSQDRYLVFEDDFVARLPAFAQILEAKGSDVLLFE